jgi:16S rRNA (guanine966-N2)-methyltransferase
VARPRPRPRLRVVAGEAGGRRLVAPAGVRPTTERVREALFASLAAAVVDAHVLDLYAGSGALAVEALSRGAAAAVLVDDDPSAVEACRANLGVTGYADQARAERSPVLAFVRAAPPPEAPFDLVLADPPYRGDDELLAVLAALAGPGWLGPDGRVVVETAAGAEPEAPAGWEVRSRRAYGDTLLSTIGPVPGP